MFSQQAVDERTRGPEARIAELEAELDLWKSHHANATTALVAMEARLAHIREVWGWACVNGTPHLSGAMRMQAVDVKAMHEAVRGETPAIVACVACGAPLSDWAREHGQVWCKACYDGSEMAASPPAPDLGARLVALAGPLSADGWQPDWCLSPVTNAAGVVCYRLVIHRPHPFAGEWFGPTPAAAVAALERAIAGGGA